MGAWADSLFTVLMSWVRALVNGIWALFSSDHTTILEFLGKNWLVIAIVLIAAGLVIDWLVWLVRWQPYHLWARRLRRLLRIPDPEDDEEEELRRKATAAQRPAARRQPEPEPQAQEDWLPLAQPDEEAARQAMAQADSVPDEELGAYPGMRYGTTGAPAPSAEDTLRYAAVHAEGPGAAEVARRRGEIDAWQQQMQEDARRQAEAERARRAQQAAEAEQARLAQEAYEAEQARLAQEAYEAEQARLAQEEYERQMAEYERQKAQYERDLAEYERQKAAYDAQLAAQQADVQQEPRDAGDQMAQRRRGAGRSVSYGDYVTGEAVGDLPDPPAWPQTPELLQTAEKPAKEKKARKDAGVMARMARMLEPEEEEIAGVRSLPPRVNMSDAYKPAKQPQKQGRRRR
ncbi:MAG: hypothetical protein MR821_04820 [Clostridiales bacterium]|nr:hypothetical protein [Clostridiales bacterium]